MCRIGISTINIFLTSVEIIMDYIDAGRRKSLVIVYTIKMCLFYFTVAVRIYEDVYVFA